MAARSYASPAAFRRALTDKLKVVARSGKWSLPQLQRQIAYDRLLERLYAVDDGWVVKGATALLARDLGVRASIDVDVFRAAALEIAERELRKAAVLDLGLVRLRGRRSAASWRRRSRPAGADPRLGRTDRLGALPRRSGRQ